MERLKDFLQQNPGHSTQELCDLLIRQVAAWCGSSAREQHDDLTLIVVDYKAA
jgi:serine phosphatase RsbU (regulator of sigma subunit)